MKSVTSRQGYAPHAFAETLLVLATSPDDADLPAHLPDRSLHGVHSDSATRDIIDRGLGGKPLGENKLGDLFVCEHLIERDETLLQSPVANAFDIQTTAIIMHFNEYLLAEVHADRNGTLFRFILSAAFGGRLQAVIQSIAQEMSQSTQEFPLRI